VSESVEWWAWEVNVGVYSTLYVESTTRTVHFVYDRPWVPSPIPTVMPVGGYLPIFYQGACDIRIRE